MFRDPPVIMQNSEDTLLAYHSFYWKWNIFKLTKTKSKKGHILAKLLRMITNIKCDL